MSQDPNIVEKNKRNTQKDTDRPSNAPTEAGGAKAQDKNNFALPSIALPKGGGAIRGIGEKFAANPVTGTGALNVPIYTSSGRSGFGPQLSLSYDSGNGNGPFGIGWTFSLPSITRKTDKGLPLYQDASESDIFILSGAEDLVPAYRKDKNGEIVYDPNQNLVFDEQDRDGYMVRSYRPRIEGLFARIERWTSKADGDVHWQSISKDNFVTIYGRTYASRISDPADKQRIFSWLICESYDDKGNAILYEYAPEDDQGVDFSKANERNRLRNANLYIRRIWYGNRLPLLLDITNPSFRKSHLEQPDFSLVDWMFEVVFDYSGEDHYVSLPLDETKSEKEQHQLVKASASGSGKAWSIRPDPFSNYRSCFEVRNYRRCQRVLMFHLFPELGAEPYLVRSTEFDYTDLDYSQSISIETELAHKGSTRTASIIRFVTQSGHVRVEPQTSTLVNGANYFTYLKASLPPLEFDYSQATIQETVVDVEPASLENLPIGVDGSHYQLVDLDGEGLSGILTEQAGDWFYKPNLGNGHLGPIEIVNSKPSLANLSGGHQQLLDLAGDGQIDLADFASPVPGFYKRTPDQNWKNFTQFNSLPNVPWGDPNLKFVDLTGDGHADILITEDQVFTWYPSLAEEGFDQAQKSYQPLNEEEGPHLIFADGTETVFLSDMSGDGLVDLVRIRNGEVCYWPNLGYGRFGAKVTMDNSPWFDISDQFNPNRIRLADIDGSGTTDIIYLGVNGVQIYFNQSGNSFSDLKLLSFSPQVDSLSSVQVADLLGNGTACLVWSSPLAVDSGRQMRYIDLMGGVKPHLLVSSKNNLGAETKVHYVASTKFYLEDKASGNPWVTRLSFPVHVVDRVETYDYVSRNRFVTRYAYHHGFFDGVEREFRGFGMVEQWDTEEIDFDLLKETTNQDVNWNAASFVPPILTRSWFHTGAYLEENRISRYFEGEYYRESDVAEGVKGLSDGQMSAMLLDDTVLPETFRLSDGTRVSFILSAEEEREACRALKGSVLRQEVYALDGTDKEDRPYHVSERNYTIELLQPQGKNPHAVFFAHPRETIDFHYERQLYDIGDEKLADPRVSHSMMLEVDEFGNILQSAAIGYGRRYDDPNPLLTDEEKEKQKRTLITYSESTYTNPVNMDDAYRTPLLSETRAFQLLKIKPDSTLGHVTNLFRFDEMVSKVESVSDGLHDLVYEQWAVDETTLSAPSRRLIEHMRSFYRSNDLAGALSLSQLQSLGLPYNSYKLAFTPELLSNVYQRKFDNQPSEELLPNPSTVLGGTGSDGGGYVDLEGNGNWWIPSGQIFYDVNADNENPAATAAAELLEASEHFFLPRKFTDPFGHSGTVDYDQNNDLLMVRVEDAVQNIVKAENDYRVLQPVQVTDPNENRSRVVFGGLGMVVGTAVMGKEIEPDGKQKGDLLDGIEPDLTQAQLDAFMAKPREPGVNPLESVATQIVHDLLGEATTRIIYDLDRFRRLGMPSFAATVTRETHNSDILLGQRSSLQISLSFSDGFGREIQKKIQAEPGPLMEGSPSISPRWVGSGWVIFNNKGLPVKKYEPFFDDTHDFRYGVKVGVSSALFYDPIERVVATLHPNHTYEKGVFDPWYQQTWDANDTLNPVQVFDPVSNVLPDHVFNPVDDPDVGMYFSRLSTDEFLPTWYDVRMDAGKALLNWPDVDPTTNSPIPENAEIRIAERSAATKAAKHASTSGRSYQDTLGRTFLTVADNGLDLNGKRQEYKTYIELDIVGNQHEVRDAKTDPVSLRGRVVMRYDYDMLRNRIHQASMEAGERWILNDVTTKPIRAWDSRGHNFRTEYDLLRRSLRRFVRGTNANHSDQRTINSEVLFEKVEYGEGQANDVVLNLRTRVFVSHDGAGIVANNEYDFKGNLSHSVRELVQEYKSIVDWSGSVQIDGTFSSSTTFDALNRPVIKTMPDNSVIRPVYNEANLLNSVDVNLRGEQISGQLVWTPFVSNIDYNGRGQRTLISYGNGVETRYRYETDTFRLIHLYTRRGVVFAEDCGNNTSPPFPAPAKPPQQPCGVQNIHYTYDPVGNISAILDDAQQTIYFNGQVVSADAEYVYDAVYRLIEASGREHIGQVLQPQSSWNDEYRVGLEHPNDGQKMRNYVESYEYDKVGNFLVFDHKASNGNWIRNYNYNEVSLIENNKNSNRLSLTVVHPNAMQPIQEQYTHDAHGNMTSMPHLQNMEWDFKDQLQHVDKGTEQVYYVYDATSQRVRKVAEKNNENLVEERIYLGSFEIFRRRNGAATVKLERETLHIMDDKQRVALVETRTQGNDPAPAQLIRYQFSNHLGSSSLELDGEALIISYEEYSPYGSTSYQAMRSQTETPKRYRYAGKERDEESGLNYHGARYYAPWLGRWTSCDPKLSQTVNAYAALLLNPISWVDLDGRAPGPPEFSIWRLGKNKFAQKFLIFLGLSVTEPETGEGKPENPFQTPTTEGVEAADDDIKRKINRVGGGGNIGRRPAPPPKSELTPDPQRTSGTSAASDLEKAEGKAVNIAGEEGVNIAGEEGVNMGEKFGVKAAIGEIVKGFFGPEDLIIVTPKLFFAFAIGDAEARSQIKADNIQAGFAIGLAASLKGMSKKDVYSLQKRIAVPRFGDRVLGTEGLAEKVENEGIAQGYLYGQHLEPWKRHALLAQSNRVLNARGYKPGDPKEVVNYVAGSLLPNVNAILKHKEEDAELREEIFRVKWRSENLWHYGHDF